MKNIVIISQARYGSSRLKGKVLLKIGDVTYLDVHLRRLSKTTFSRQIVVATTLEPESDQIIKIAQDNGCSSFRGSMTDVLDRYYHAAKEFKADIVVRVTSDCPLIDPSLLDEVVAQYLEEPVDYLSNINPPSFPDGQDIEIMTFSSLERAWNEATQSYDREHVTPYLRNKSNGFKVKNFSNSKDFSHIRMTLDTQVDHARLSCLITKFTFEKTWLEYVELIEKNLC
jgi:spore coat polysaccharide biosynthesis protein SpsF